MTATRGRGRPRAATGALERIVAAALHEFGEHGYDDATVRAIAAGAEADAAQPETRCRRRRSRTR
ncbi:TetR family transcriptional regulator [Microbacterium sp. A82]|uniref:TetR family transcriptional regulator n=1 Tax=Microbacterium sp. A82 TaxID=3450452 RepID=UPI003F3D6F46